MQRKSLTIVVLSVILLTLAAGGLSNPAKSQSLGAPLFLVMDGDIWAWTDSSLPLKNLTTSGGVKTGSLSPDGTMIVYVEVSEFVRQAFEKQPWAGLVPLDVHVLDLATGSTLLIAGQPEDISVIERGNVYPNTDRSYPVWSPDSTMLAWAELTSDGENPHSLVVYDLIEQKVKFSKPIAYLELPAQVFWGTPGIVVQDIAADEIVYQVINGEGEVIASTLSPGHYTDAFLWFKDNDQDYLYLAYSGEDYEAKFFDPSSGQLSPASSTLERYALSAPEGASVYPNQVNSVLLHQWSEWLVSLPGLEPIAPLGFESITLPAAPHYRIAISPDGQSVAYVHDGTVTIYQAGELIETGIEVQPRHEVALLWSALGWRVRHQN